MSERRQVSDNFYLDEFECPCCGVADVQDQLIKGLQAIRGAYGKPMVVTSGYRCTKRNTAIGGSRMSTHLFGLASDIACDSSVERFQLVWAALDAGCQRVGVYSKHVHFDFDSTRDQQVLWHGDYK